VIGRDADRIAAAVANAVPMCKCKSMRDAVLAASRVAEPGDSVLLAPACASFDMFENYEARGTAFTNEVKDLQR